jgi:hypothetical protein
VSDREALLKKLGNDRVLALLRYDPGTGVFTWRVDHNYNAKTGEVAGARFDGGRYWTIGIDGENYLAHRLAWLYMTGEWPPADIDHRNRVGTDNRWDNLRLATPSQNLANAKKRSDNTSGVKGVSWFKQTRKWRAYVCQHGKETHLGYYATLEEARLVRQAKAAELFGEFNREC